MFVHHQSKCTLDGQPLLLVAKMLANSFLLCNFTVILLSLAIIFLVKKLSVYICACWVYI